MRVRLVSGFLVAMLVLLTAAGVLVFWRVQYALDRGLDSELDRATSVISPLVDDSGKITSLAAANATGTGWQVLDRDGVVLDMGGPAPTEAVVSPSVLARIGKRAYTVDIGTLLPRSKRPHRIHVTAVRDGGVVNYLAVSVRRDHRDEALRELLLQLTLAGAGSLIGAAVVGDLLARAALRPVERFRSRAEDIAGGSAGLRLDVPPGRDDEVTRLGHTLNDMLAALESSIEHERRFVNDASHELRTPLTLLKSRIQLARRRSRTTEEHEEILDELAIDVARLADLAEQMLELGSVAFSKGASCDVNDVVEAFVAHRRASGNVRPEQLSSRRAKPSADAAIDAIALERVVANLVDNAFVHGAPPVAVTVDLLAGAGGDWLRIEVTDQGQGMSQELLADATNRFARAPEARSRPGSGLGLSLVMEIVEEAGGELRLCVDHTHVRHGDVVGVPCPDHVSMTATVFLPQSRRTQPSPRDGS